MYDVLIIVFGMFLVILRNFCATIGLKKAMSVEERAGQARTRTYQIKKWDSIIVGTGFILLGAYWLYLNLMKMSQ